MLEGGAMSAKVMIVDDSLMVRQQVRTALDAAGFAVVEANDGADALQKLAASPDMSLVVLDINMPNMNGIEFLRTLRGLEQYVRLPVVMLTTEGHPELMKQAKSLGAKGWIIKPFKAELLIAAVQRLTQPS
jgi:two-component system, chemotaxis family, chemotaxis protein CheY